jgi:hypothetical protein
MQFLHLVLAARDLAAASPVAGMRLTAGVPNPAPQAPPGMAGPVGTLLGWFKWGALVGGVFGRHRGRHQCCSGGNTTSLGRCRLCLRGSQGRAWSSHIHLARPAGWPCIR